MKEFPLLFAHIRKTALLLILTMMAMMAVATLQAQSRRADPVDELDRLLGRKKTVASSQKAHEDLATVDLAFLMLFHPGMQLYHFDSRRFEQPFPDGTTPEGRTRIFKERAVARSRTAQQNRSRFDKLNRDRFEVSQEIARLAEDLNEKTLNLKNRAGEPNLAGKLADLENRFWKKKKELEDRFNELNDEMVKIDEQANKKLFSSQNSRERKFNAMEDEILEAITTVARIRGYGTVLNSSFVEPSVARAIDPLDAKEYGEHISEFDNPYAALWSQTPDKSVGRDEDAGRLSSLVTRWTGYRSRVLSEIVDRPLNRLVLTGGKDLTLDVLAYLLKKHRMAEDRARLLLKTLQSLQKKG